MLGNEIVIEQTAQELIDAIFSHQCCTFLVEVRHWKKKGKKITAKVKATDRQYDVTELKGVDTESDDGLLFMSYLLDALFNRSSTADAIVNL